jgi:hypothetical protein
MGRWIMLGKVVSLIGFPGFQWTMNWSCFDPVADPVDISMDLDRCCLAVSLAMPIANLLYV